MKSIRVIIGAPDENSGEFSYAEGLAGALTELDCEVSILLSGGGDEADPQMVPCRASVPVHRVPARTSDGLAEYWLEVIRFLEERAPCLFLCGPTGMADRVYPRLSGRILVVPILHYDDRVAYEYSRLLGGSFDAVVPMNPSLRQRLLADISDLAPRLATLPANPLDGASMTETRADFLPSAKACLSLVDELVNGARSVPHLRKSGRMPIPSSLPDGVGDRKSLESAVQFVNWKPRWPDPIATTPVPPAAVPVLSRTPPSLSSVRIVVGLTSGRISGVDIFSINLVRELRRIGLRAELLQTMAGSSTSDALPVAMDVPTTMLSIPECPTWRQRWASLKACLESEPTIFLPNYDDRHSAVIPALASHVRTVGIGHSDDPHYYQHILRLASSWDAVVAVSSTIERHLTALSPALASRLSVVPYGVHVPPVFGAASRSNDDTLRVVYAGRLVQYQKRVFDLLRIADEATSGGLNIELTIAGSGEDAERFAERAARNASPRMSMVGSISNEDVLQLLRQSHVFLLPSSFEGLPVSLIEAMANGCVPVVAAMRSGVPDLIDHGRNGFVFGVGDSSASARSLARLAEDEGLRIEMSRAAYETVRTRYTVEHMTKQYVEVFERILAAPYPRPVGPLSPPRSIHALDANMPPFPLPVRKLIASARERIN